MNHERIDSRHNNIPQKGIFSRRRMLGAGLALVILSAGTTALVELDEGNHPLPGNRSLLSTIPEHTTVTMPSPVDEGRTSPQLLTPEGDPQPDIAP